MALSDSDSSMSESGKSRRSTSSRSSGSKSRSRSKSSSRSRSRSGGVSSSSSSDPKGKSPNSGKETTPKKEKRLSRKERSGLSRLGESLGLSSDSSEDEESSSKTQSESSSSNKRSKEAIRGSSKKSTKISEERNVHHAEQEEFDDGLDEDLIGDNEDRNMLENLSEMQREQELFRRAEKREELKKRYEIAQKLKLNQKEKSKSPTKEKSEGELSSDSDSEHFKRSIEIEGRKKGYEVKHATKFNALNQLKAKRDEKEKKDKERKEKESKVKRKKQDSSSSNSDLEKLSSKRSKKKSKGAQIYSSDSDSAQEARRRSSSSSSSSSRSSSSSTEREKPKTKEIKALKPIESIEDLEKIRLSRFKLDKFVHLPCFEKTVIGCFVKVSIGNNPGTGGSTYRAAEIVGVVETAKIYDVMKGSNRSNVGLRLKLGRSTRVFRAQFVSNQPFTESEFLKWKKTCEDENVDLPLFKQVEERMKAIEFAMNYRFSNTDVNKILQKKEQFSKGPRNLAVKKVQLMKDKVNAEHEGRTSDVNEIMQKLADLEERAEKKNQQRVGDLSNISYINDRNRKANVARAEKGIREEQERVKQEGKVDDPFTRRKTRPVLSMPKKDEEPIMTSQLLMEMEKQNKVDNSVEEKENMEEAEKAAKGGGTASGPQNIFDAHDFDIDVNIGGMDTSETFPSIAVKPAVASLVEKGPAKRRIKLEDYKKRKGII